MENGNVNSSRNYAAPPLSLIYISMVKLSVKSGSNVRLEVKYSKVFFFAGERSRKAQSFKNVRKSEIGLAIMLPLNNFYKTLEPKSLGCLYFMT